MSLDESSPRPSTAVQMVVAMNLAQMNAALREADAAPTHLEKNVIMHQAVKVAKHLMTQVPKDQIQLYLNFDTFFHVIQVAGLEDMLVSMEKRDRVLHKTDVVRCIDKKKQRGLLKLIIANTPPEPGARPARNRARASAAAHPYKAARALKRAERDAPRTAVSHDHAGPDADAAELDPAFLALFAKTNIEEANQSPPDNHAANVDNVCDQLLAFHLPPKPAPSTLVARSNNHRQPLVGKPYARPAAKAKRA